MKKILLIPILLIPLVAYGLGSNRQIKTSKEIELRPNARTDSYGDFVLKLQNEIRFEDASGGEYISIKAPDPLAGNVDFLLPGDDGDSGQFLQTDGLGTLSWQDVDLFTPANDNRLLRADTVGSSGIQEASGAVVLNDTDELSGLAKLSVSGRMESITTAIASHPCPSMDTSQRDAIASPVDGDCIHNTDDDELQFYDGGATVWKSIGTGGGGGALSNLLVDPGFEEGITEVTANVGTTSVASGSEAFTHPSSAQSLKISLSSEQADVEQCETDLAWASMNVEVSCLMKTSLATASLASSDDTNDFLSVLYDGSDIWKRVVSSMVVPASGTACWRVVTGSAVTGDIYLDDCKIVPLEPSVATATFQQEILDNDIQDADWDTAGTITFNITLPSSGDTVLLQRRPGSVELFTCQYPKCSVDAYIGGNTSGSGYMRIRKYDTDDSTILFDALGGPHSTAQVRESVQFILEKNQSIGFFESAAVDSTQALKVSIVAKTHQQSEFLTASIDRNYTEDTLSSTNFGTPTDAKIFWKRDGKDMVAHGHFTGGGSPSASPGSIELPDGLTIDHSAIGTASRSPLGRAFRAVGGLNWTGTTGLVYLLHSDGSDPDSIFFGDNPSGAAIEKSSGNDIGTGDGVLFHFRVPIAEWSGVETVAFKLTDHVESPGTTAGLTPKLVSAVVSGTEVITEDTAGFLSSCTDADPSVCTLAASFFTNDPKCWTGNGASSGVTADTSSSVTIDRTDASTAFTLFCHGEGP